LIIHKLCALLGFSLAIVVDQNDWPGWQALLQYEQIFWYSLSGAYRNPQPPTRDSFFYLAASASRSSPRLPLYHLSDAHSWFPST